MDALGPVATGLYHCCLRLLLSEFCADVASHDHEFKGGNFVRTCGRVGVQCVCCSFKTRHHHCLMCVNHILCDCIVME